MWQADNNTTEIRGGTTTSGEGPLGWQTTSTAVAGQKENETPRNVSNAVKQEPTKVKNTVNLRRTGGKLESTSENRNPLGKKKINREEPNSNIHNLKSTMPSLAFIKKNEDENIE